MPPCWLSSGTSAQPEIDSVPTTRQISPVQPRPRLRCAGPTPATAGFGDENLHLGQSWTTPGGNYIVTLDWANSIGAHVTITLNRVIVPDVRGLNVGLASARLGAAGLTVGNVHYYVDITCGDDLNLVTGQSPAAGTQVRPGTAVTLDIAVPPAPPAHCA